MILGAVLAAAFFAVWVWQSAGKLSQAELHHYIGILEKELPQEMEDRAEFIARLRAWGENDDGRPVFMLNLMRYHDQLKPFPAHRHRERQRKSMLNTRQQPLPCS